MKRNTIKEEGDLGYLANIDELEIIESIEELGFFSLLNFRKQIMLWLFSEEKLISL